MSQWILYHLLSHAHCAEVRAKIVELELEERVRFRNIGISEDAERDLIALVGRVEVPCLHVENQVILGREIIPALERYKGSP